MIQLFPNGKSEVLEIGADITRGQHTQVIVPKGTWQGARLKAEGKFAFLGCTVAPGLEFADYQSADKRKLLTQYPNIRHIISELA